MSEDYSHQPSSTEDGSDCELPPYADTPLSYVEQPSPSFKQSSPSAQQPAQLTEEAQLAAAYQLGNVLKHYKGQPSAFTTEGLPPAAPKSIRLAVLTLLIITLGVWWVARTPPWPLILISSLTLAPWLSNIFSRLPTDMIAALQNTELYLCTNGLMIIKWTRVQALRWEQIQAIQHCRTQNILRPYYILYLDGGKTITLQWSLVGDGIKDLGNHIEHEVCQCLLPKAIASYEAGEVLNFGPITVTAQGLTLEDEQRSLPWERFASIKYYNGHSFAIKERATALTWQQIEIESMLNFCVFLPLITHIKNSLPDSIYQSDDTTTQGTAEEETVQRCDAYHSIQEQLLAQKEEQERLRKMHAEILERLRNSRQVTPIPEEVIQALRVLDLPSEASLDVIHQRYRLLAKRYHPDTGGDPETFKRINAAYKCVLTWITSQDQ
jgi:branched-subunit amino acid transport protein